MLLCVTVELDILRTCVFDRKVCYMMLSATYNATTNSLSLAQRRCTRLSADFTGGLFCIKQEKT